MDIYSSTLIREKFADSIPTANPGDATPWVHQSGAVIIGNSFALAISDVTGLQAALDAKALDSGVVHIAGAETITGAKTFSSNVTINTTSEPQLLLQESGVAKGSMRGGTYPQIAMSHTDNFSIWTNAQAMIMGGTSYWNFRGNAGIKIRNYADTADAPISASTGTFSGTLKVGGTGTGATLDGSIASTLTLKGPAGTGSSNLSCANITCSTIFAGADGTYDIGQSGSFRFRDLYLSRNAAIGGSVSVGGDITLPAANKIARASDTTQYIQLSGSGETKFYSPFVSSASVAFGFYNASGGTIATFAANGSAGLGVTPAVFSGWTNGRVLHVYDATNNLPHIRLQSSTIDALIGVSGGGLTFRTDSSISFLNASGSGSAPISAGVSTFTSVTTTGNATFGGDVSLGAGKQITADFLLSNNRYYVGTSTNGGVVKAITGGGVQVRNWADTGAGIFSAGQATFYGTLGEVKIASSGAVIEFTRNEANYLLATGASSSLVLGTANTNRWKVSSGGHFIAVTDNTYDIGESGTSRPRNVYVGGTVRTNSLIVDTSAQFVINTYFTSSEGVSRLYFSSNAGTIYRCGTASSSSAGAHTFRDTSNIDLMTIDGAGNTQVKGSWLQISSDVRFNRSAAQQLKREAYDSVLAAWQEVDRIEASASGAKWSVFGVTAVVQQTGGVMTAGAAYTANEQTMLQTMWNAMRTYGLLN